MKRNWINITAAIVILISASSISLAQQATSTMMMADCTSTDGDKTCKCDGACWADADSCGCN